MKNMLEEKAYQGTNPGEIIPFSMVAPIALICILH